MFATHHENCAKTSKTWKQIRAITFAQVHGIEWNLDILKAYMIRHWGNLVRSKSYSHISRKSRSKVGPPHIFMNAHRRPSIPHRYYSSSRSIYAVLALRVMDHSDAPRITPEHIKWLLMTPQHHPNHPWSFLKTSIFRPRWPLFWIKFHVGPRQNLEI